MAYHPIGLVEGRKQLSKRITTKLLRYITFIKEVTELDFNYLKKYEFWDNFLDFS